MPESVGVMTMRRYGWALAFVRVVRALRRCRLVSRERGADWCAWFSSRVVRGRVTIDGKLVSDFHISADDIRPALLEVMP